MYKYTFTIFNLIITDCPQFFKSRNFSKMILFQEKNFNIKITSNFIDLVFESFLIKYQKKKWEPRPFNKRYMYFDKSIGKK